MRPREQAMVLAGVRLGHILVFRIEGKELARVEQITTAIVTALSTGGVFVVKEVATQGVKDAYAGLKDWIKRHYPGLGIEELEKQPISKASQEVVGKGLERDGASEDAELVKLARTVIELIQKEAPEVARSIGVDLGELDQAKVTIGKVLAGKGATAVKVGKVTRTRLSVGDVTAGSDTDSSKKA